jgi:bla regulator protein BlaR1
MTEGLTNHLWQSTVFGAMAGLLTLLLRKNHARARYWVWLAASVKFLVPFALLVSLGSHFGWRKTHLHAAAPLAIERFSPVFTPVVSVSISAVKPHSISLMPILLWALWCCGCAAVLLAWCVRWRRTARIIRTAAPLTEGLEVETLRRLRSPIEIVSSNARFEPGVFGILRPILLWPAGISERLADRQIEAILAHEVSHVRRRDNLAAALHMLVEAVFWFHPLVWWIGSRLVSERETACDQDVLRLDSEPEVYAQGILKICEYCLEAPLLCVSGVSGADLKKRIQGIMTHTMARDLGTTRKLLLAIAGIVAIAAPIAIGLMNAPSSQAQTQAPPPPPPPPPFQPPVANPDGPLPQFEVASIKPAAPDQRGTFIRPGANGGININNMGLKELITFAWRIQPYQISGAPSWIESAHYDISATGNHKPKPDELPLMIQALLADRFQLKVHHETKELPIYALVLANKDGKLGPQLKESKEGSCTPFDPTKPPPPFEPGKPPAMGCGGMFMGPARLDAKSVDLAMLTPSLARMLGRTVVDKTGLTGKFDFQLQWTPDQAQLQAMAPPGGLPPGMPVPQFDANGPSIFTALQEQLGLKLESQKGPVDILVIDHLERPSEN